MMARVFSRRSGVSMVPSSLHAVSRTSTIGAGAFTMESAEMETFAYMKALTQFVCQTFHPCDAAPFPVFGVDGFDWDFSVVGF